MRILSASGSSGLTRWYPPRPTIETISPVCPSLRRGTCPLDSAPFVNEGTPASTEAPVAISRNCLLSTIECSITLSLSRGCQRGLCPQNLTEQKQISKKGAKMDRRVQVVDQLRADGGLCQNQLDGGERVAGVAVQHRQERRAFHGRPTAFCQAIQRAHGATQKFADSWAGLIAWKPLRRVGEHELVALFDSVTALQNFGWHLS